MKPREFLKWLKTQADLNPLQELYAIVLEGNHGLDAVMAWLDGKPTYYDPDFKETVVFYGEKRAQNGE